jgi:amino acid transporter
MDGSRALYGISKDGMTIRELGVLNRHNVPGRAMTLDAILNIILISGFAGVFEILAVSNVGYVFATCAALSGFVLLRRDRPNWPRPIRLPNYWVPLAFVLFLINLTLLIGGAFIYSGGFLGIEGYEYYGWSTTRTGLIVLLAAVVLYVWRHSVQDKIPMRWREPIPQTPEEERAHAELKTAPTAQSV